MATSGEASCIDDCGPRNGAAPAPIRLCRSAKEFERSPRRGRSEVEMGFMDKAKATAEKAAEKMQQGVQQGQQKLSEVQEKKRVEGLLKELGTIIFLDKTGR